MAERPILIIDIETRPDPALLDDAEHWTRVFDELEPPKNYKDPLVIEKWKRERLVELRDGCALHAHTGRLAAVGIALLNTAWEIEEEPWVGLVNEVNADEERRILGDFRVTLRSYLGQDIDYVIAGWNLRDFDLPFLLGRAVALQAPMPARWPRTKDWVRVLDGYEYLGGKLADWMRVCGLPPKAADGEATLQLSLPDLGLHCRDDLIATRAVFRRMVESNPLLLGESR